MNTDRIGNFLANRLADEIEAELAECVADGIDSYPDRAEEMRFAGVMVHGELTVTIPGEDGSDITLGTVDAAALLPHYDL